MKYIGKDKKIIAEQQTSAQQQATKQETAKTDVASAPVSELQKYVDMGGAYGALAKQRIEIKQYASVQETAQKQAEQTKNYYLRENQIKNKPTEKITNESKNSIEKQRVRISYIFNPRSYY